VAASGAAVKLRWLLVAGIALLLHTGSALAQPEEARSAGPDVPAGPAAVSGRIVHETRPAAAAEVEVILYALSEDGDAGLRVGVTDAEGRFRFENVSNAPGVVYLLGARSGEIPFGSRFTFGAGEREHRVELVLSDPVRDADAAEAGGFDLRIERGCTHLRVSHSHAVTNPGERDELTS
jgi:hypothetical protein